MDIPSKSNRNTSNRAQFCENLSKSQNRFASRFLLSNQNNYSKKFIKEYD